VEFVVNVNCAGYRTVAFSESLHYPYVPVRLLHPSLTTPVSLSPAILLLYHTVVLLHSGSAWCSWSWAGSFSIKSLGRILLGPAHTN
jgi:hypothetical protein